HREPNRLVEHQHVGVFVERDRFEELPRRVARTLGLACLRPRLQPQRRGAHRPPRPRPLPRRGGSRPPPPASSLCLGCARLPFTRSSPFRMIRWIWENARPGKRASRKRSTRMPASSSLTFVVCTPPVTARSAPFSASPSTPNAS